VIEETENVTYARGIDLASGDTVFIKTVQANSLEIEKINTEAKVSTLLSGTEQFPLYYG
jgi:hypothetical protein